MNTTNIDQRLNFENAYQLALSLGYNLTDAVCTQGFIRSEAALSTGTANYQMPLVVNQANQTQNSRVLNNLLNMQDILVVNSCFIGWTVATATSGTGKLYTYPNEVAATSAAIATQLNALYNGKLNIMNNNQNVVPAWDISRHYVAPRTQTNTNFNVAAPTAPAVYAADSNDFSVDGFYPVEPNWVINGAGNMQAFINLASGMSSIPTNGAIVMILRGVLLQNVTTVK
jgi:hypothetical protein